MDETALPHREDELHAKDTHNLHSTPPNSLNKQTNPSIPDKTPTGQKLCFICHGPSNVLIRCQTSTSSPLQNPWVFVHQGPCHYSVSGGKLEGTPEFPEYKYGGMWKNKRKDVEGSVSGKLKEKGFFREAFVRRTNIGAGWKMSKGKRRERMLREEGFWEGRQGEDGEMEMEDEEGENEEDEDLRRAIEASLEDQNEVGGLNAEIVEGSSGKEEFDHKTGAADDEDEDGWIRIDSPTPSPA